MKCRYLRWLTSIIIIFVYLNGCSSGSVESEPIDNGYDQGGLYALTGSKIINDQSGKAKPLISESKSDTIRLSFTVNILWNNENRDRVRIIGLYGADVGNFTERVFPGCIMSDDCKVFGSFINHENIEIDIENNGRRYQANGQIKTVDIELRGQYTHQDHTINYELSGERIFF